MIDAFQTHPKYETALGIIRAKIIGPPSDIITNHRTANNIRAIIRTLDSAYRDQRPLYVVEAEMTSIRQLGKSLQQYYECHQFRIEFGDFKNCIRLSGTARSSGSIGG